jgi:hypothetical protein
MILVSGASAYSVSFANSFKSTTYAIGITAQDMDLWRLLSNNK